MRQKKLLAIIMAVILVITSVTISYKMSEAEEPTVSGVNIVLDLGTDSYNGKTFSVSFNLSDNNECDFTESYTVVDNKITVSDKTLVAGKLYNVIVTLTDTDGVEYSGNTSITTPGAEAAGDDLNVSGSVNVAAVTYSQVVITLDSAEYTGVSVVEEGYSITTPGADGKCTITKNDSSAIEKGTNIHLKSSKDGINYNKSLSINSESINVGFASSDEESYDGITINLGDTYSGIKITGEGFTVERTNTNTVELTNLIKKGVGINVSASKDGLNYTGAATVTTKIFDVTLTPTQYKLSITRPEDVIVKYSEGDGNKIEYNNNSIFDKDKTYNFEVVAPQNKVLNVNGVSSVNKSLSSNNSDWKEEADFTLTGIPSNQTIVISVEKPKLTSVGIKIGDTTINDGGTIDNVYPSITKNFEVVYSLEGGYPLPDGFKYQATIDNEHAQYINDTELSSGMLIVKPDYNDIDEFAGMSINLTKASDSNDVVNDNNISANIKLNVTEAAVIYGTDYTISDKTVLYADPDYNDGSHIYYKDSDASKVTLLKRNYLEFRAKILADLTNEKIEGDFSAISDGGTKVDLGNGILRIQMRNTEKIASGNITLIRDNDAPKITVTPDTDVPTDNIEGVNYYFVNGNKKIIAEANDEKSGLKMFAVSPKDIDITGDGTVGKLESIISDIQNSEDCTVINSGDDISKSSCVVDEQCNTLYLYAIDNVGNISKQEVNIAKDTNEPTVDITVEKPELLTKEDNTYYLNNENLELTISAKDGFSGLAYIDTNGKGTLVTSESNNPFKIYEVDDNNNIVTDSTLVPYGNSFEDGEYTVKVNVPSSPEKQYKLYIKIQDLAGNVHEETITIIVDTTDPVIDDFILDKFAVDNNTSIKGATNSGRYKFKVTEANLLKVELQYKLLDGTDKTIQLFDGDTPVDNNVYEFNKLLEDQLINEEATIIAYDKAGNEPANFEFTYSFDNKEVNFVSATNKSTPLAEVSDYDVVGKNAVIEFKIKEKNFREDLFGCKIQKLDGSGEYVDDTTVAVTPQFTVDGSEITITCNIDFASDGRYKVIGYYNDIALHTRIGEEYSGEYKSNPKIMEYKKVLVSDNTTPVLKSTVTVDKTNKTMTVDYTLTETNPDFKKSEFTINAKNNLGDVDNAKINDSVVPINNIENILKDEGTWKKNNDGTYSTKIVFETEGEYSINITPKDYAAHTGSVNSVKEIFDITAPKTESLTVTTPYNTSNTDFSQFATGEKEKEAELTIKVSDLVSKDTVSVDYEMISQESSTPSTNNKKLTLNRTDKDVFEGSVKIDPNFKGVLKFKYTDTNGNSTTEEIKYNNGIVVENAEQHALTSDVTITDLNTSDARKGIYNEDVRFNLATLATYSGINNVECTINGVAQNLNGAFDSGNITTSWNQDLSINSDTFEGNDIEVVFTMTDNAQFKKTTTATYAIDKTAPVIRVSYDNNSPLNERYYNATRTATISVDELNFENSDVDITATRNGSSMSIPANFSTDGVQRTNAAGKKYYTYVMSIPFAEDGDYTFTITVTDMAGNVTSYGQTDEFTIDKTNPEIRISYNNNNALNGNYYGEARVATITVNEHNFDPASVKVNLTAQGAGVPAVSGFSNNGDVHTATVSFSEDADYTISANCVDLAGNESNSIAEEAFTVDLTDPVIEITGINSNESYKGSVNPVVTVTDTNYDLDGVEITIVGGKHGLKEVGSDIANIENGQTFTYSDLRHIQDNDDSYTIKAVATDKAGHSSEEIMTYRVNRYGSIYTLNDELLKAVENYYATSSDKYAIIEENVDEVEKYTITYTVDNDIVNLEEGSDFTVKADKNKDDWNENVYTLSADSFEKEGVYNISISSEDSVGNVSDNKSKGLDVEFCIDNTKPVCIISGVAEGQEIKKDASADIVIEAYDNIKFADMKVEVNGEVLATEKDMEDGKVSFKLKPNSGAQVLKVTCHDAAGNEELQVVNFTFDVGVLKTHKTFVIVIAVILALLAAGFIFFIIAKRRRDNQ